MPLVSVPAYHSLPVISIMVCHWSVCHCMLSMLLVTQMSVYHCMVSMPFVSIPLHSQYATCQYTTDQYNTVGQYAIKPPARYAAGQYNTTGQYMPAVSMPLATNPPARYTAGQHATGQCKAFSLGIRRRVLSLIPSVVTTSILSFSSVTHLSHSSMSPTLTMPALSYPTWWTTCVSLSLLVSVVLSPRTLQASAYDSINLLPLK